MNGHYPGDVRCELHHPAAKREGLTYHCTVCVPVTCPSCDWQITGLKEEVLSSFQAHGLLAHGRRPLRWTPCGEGGYVGS